jgi:hypothetical protein
VRRLPRRGPGRALEPPARCTVLLAAAGVSGPALSAQRWLRGCDSGARTAFTALPQTGDGTSDLFPSLPPTMDPQSFILGLMAGITLIGGAILIAMILLERPRCRQRPWSSFFCLSAGRLRDWLAPKWPRRKITEEWLQAQADLARLHETASQQPKAESSAAAPEGHAAGRAEKTGRVNKKAPPPKS